MIDRSTKVLLAAIAFGLWANAWNGLAPVVAVAQDLDYIQRISQDFRKIANGSCSNGKIC